MKRIATFFTLLLIAPTFFAQETDTVSLGAGYTKQVYYSLETGTKTSTIKNDWDLAFETSNQGYSILINAATGTEAYLYPGDTSDWSILDTTGMSAWTQRTNSDTSWSYGALSQDQNGFDVGWGTYNMITHYVIGDRIFVVKLGNGSWQKLWIKSLIGGVYTFRHATLNGSVDMIHKLDKANFFGKNFGYFSMQNHSSVDKEPAADSWDLFFGQYTTYIPQPYLVSGVLQSPGTLASKAYPVNDSSTYEDFGAHPFMKEINTIGYDWKPYNMSTMMYEIVDSTVYFVKTNAGAVWKMVFLHFGGSADGNMVFTKKQLVAAGVSEHEFKADFAIYPNPASDIVNIVYNHSAQVNLQVTNLGGQVVKSEVLSGNGLNYTLNISDLQAGIYLIHLVSEEGMVSKKLIVQ